MNSILFSLSTGTKSLVEELFDYFAENYLNSSVAYPNLGLSGNSIVTLPAIVTGIVIAVLVATVAATYETATIGGFVRRMLEGGAVGKKNATTLYGMGESERGSAARALRKSVGLRRLIACVEEEDFYENQAAEREEYEAKRQNDKSLPEFCASEYKFVGNEHFYIRSDKKISAEIKYAKRSLKLISIPIVIIACVIAFFGLMLLIPNILKLLDQLIGSMKSL